MTTLVVLAVLGLLGVWLLVGLLVAILIGRGTHLANGDDTARHPRITDEPTVGRWLR